MEQCVSVLRRSQMLELRRRRFRLGRWWRLQEKRKVLVQTECTKMVEYSRLPSILGEDSSKKDWSYYLQIVWWRIADWIRPVVELPMKFSWVEIFEKVLELAWHIHVLVVGEQVHVPETVDRYQREVFLWLSQVMQRMSKFDAVSNQKVDVFFKGKNAESIELNIMSSHK